MTDRNSRPTPTRRVVVGGAVAAAAAAVLLTETPPAFALGGSYAIAFKANTNALWWTASGDHSQGMKAGTSPAMAGNGRGGYQLAFQANTGALIVYGDDIKKNTAQGMDAASSPAIARLSDGRYVVAFQANNHDLYRWDSQYGPARLNLGMMTGTSPSIAAGPSGSYRIAFQANTGELWTYDSASGGGQDWHQGMAPFTSPSITWAGGWQMAFQANTSNLYTFGGLAKANLRLGMAPRTSPVIAQGSSGYRIAFQANTASLWHWDSQSGPKNWALGMQPGTSPAIVGLSGGGYQLAFQANTGNLWSVGDAGSPGDLKLGMDSKATSPSLAGGYGSAAAIGRYNAGILAGANRYPNNYPYGQQCLVFVEDQIRYAGGPSIHMPGAPSTYQSIWAQFATGQSWATVAPGDICQWYDGHGEHTVIITGGNSPTNATVVDSNYGYNMRVNRGSWSSRDAGFAANTYKLWRVK
ncbi:hypothetical protein [Leekyejoonella antrihumi]|uniref:CHAP domain-containing protein n=1 Tax=Leekyejoonella antrihumi TaxID=1660198 RepID=A0A563DSN9_9MICO|nr:hypothetical protein [Leekyejoonella antrihumi]TWP33003.1 hypothetical protein FGL98_22675 [Leekyejoonella antrihumi]